MVLLAHVEAHGVEDVALLAVLGWAGQVLGTRCPYTRRSGCSYGRCLNPRVASKVWRIANDMVLKKGLVQTMMHLVNTFVLRGLCFGYTFSFWDLLFEI